MRPQQNTRLLPRRLLLLIIFGAASVLLSAEALVPEIARAEGEPLVQERTAEDAISGKNASLLPEVWARESAILKVMPLYPEEAVRNGISGIVHIKFATNREGEVLQIKVRPRTDPLLATAVANAVKQWRFKPRRAPDGTAKPVISRLIFSFKIDTTQPRVEMYNPSPRPPDVQNLGYYNSAKELREWRDWQEVLPNSSKP